VTPMSDAGSETSSETSSERREPSRSVLITGGSGYLGSQLVEQLAADRGGLETLVSLDLRPVPEAERLPGVVYEAGDIREPVIADLLDRYGVDTVVHLAAIVTPGKHDSREFLHSIDVGGTQNVFHACLDAGVRRFIVTSSGAAYGYYADNSEPLREDDAIRGNPEFAYSDHKRQVEEFLAQQREVHPEIEQVLFRPGTILGSSAQNQITALFEGRVVLGVQGSDTPFVFIWDQDVVGCLVEAVRGGRAGIYNLAGDGVMTLADIADVIGKRVVSIPAWLIRAVLGVLHPLGLAQYGPEQVDFLRYRPVLSNERLRIEFGYKLRKTSREAFDFFWAHHRSR
jgi:UDP-glucose 4-epimerase